VTNFVQQHHIPEVFKDWFLCIVMILILFGFLFGMTHVIIYVSSIIGFDLEIRHALMIMLFSFVIFFILWRRTE